MYFPFTIKNYDIGWFGTIIYKNGGFRDFCLEYRGKNWSPVSCDPGGVRCHNTTSPSRCWPPRIEMAAANIRKSYRNLRPHFHRRQLMEGVGVLSTQYSLYFISDTLCGASVDVLILTTSTIHIVSVVLWPFYTPFFMPPPDPSHLLTFHPK